MISPDQGKFTEQEAAVRKMNQVVASYIKLVAIDALSELSREYPQRFPDFGRFIRDSIQAEATSSR